MDKANLVADTLPTEDAAQAPSESEYLEPEMMGTVYPPPNLERLRAALKVLDPDCPDRTWAVHRIAPLANAALEHPELAEELFRLAVVWSRGELRGRPATTWAMPGPHGTARRGRLHYVWAHYYHSTYTGKRVSVGTIFYDAMEARRKADEFEVLGETGKGVEGE